MMWLYSLLLLSVLSIVTVSGQETFDYMTSYRYLHYAYAAYEGGANVRVGVWKCKMCTNTTVNFQVTAACYGDTEQGAFAFVGYNDDYNEIVASYRGSMNIQNWIEDFEFWQTPNATFSPQYPDALIEHGFGIFYNATKECVVAAVQDLQSKNPSYTTTYTGHSLGAAGATVAVMDAAINLNAPPVNLMNFGSPRVGNKAFSDLAAKNLASSQRMVNAGDCVPKVPWLDTLDRVSYYHIPSEIYEYPAQANNFTVCSPTDGESCGDGAKWDCADHLTYMGLNLDAPSLVEPNFDFMKKTLH